jgi:hypothetical protein
MKHVLTIVLSAAAAFAATAGDLRAQTAQGTALLGEPYLFRVAPRYLYPDRALTPGQAETFSAAAILHRYKCPRRVKKKKNATCTYSQAHRYVPDSVKNAVYAAYDKLYPGLAAYCHALDAPKAQRKRFTTGKAQAVRAGSFLSCRHRLLERGTEPLDTACRYDLQRPADGLSSKGRPRGVGDRPGQGWRPDA